ncbi:MAG: EI24 domain-containing protein [Candidatus Cloacimonetes bacterium]|nr:EI24 domain-containing protein [Candidatus Cloacimonadota bacterium]
MSSLLVQSKSFAYGLSSAFGVIGYLKNHKKNLSYVVVPFAINILVGMFSVWFAFVAMANYFPITWPAFSFSFLFIKSCFSTLFNLLIHLSFLLSSYIIGFSIVCSTFYGWMVEKIERSMGLETSIQSLSILNQIRDSIVISGVLVVVSFLSIIVSFFPFIGPFCTIFIGFPLQAFVLGVEFFDFSQSIRAMTIQNKASFAKENLGGVFACGLISLCFLPFPIINSCLFTISILSATFHLRKVKFQELLEKTYPDEKDKLKLLTKGNQDLKSIEIDGILVNYLECTHQETNEIYRYGAQGHISKS